jgi:hypothetical protein
VANTHNKNQNKMIIVKGKGIANKFNGKCFIYTKIEQLDKDIKNKNQ